MGFLIKKKETGIQKRQGNTISVLPGFVIGILIAGLFSILSGCNGTHRFSSELIKLSSPNNKYRFEIHLNKSQIYYQTFFNNIEIVEKSSLGFELKEYGLIPKKFFVQSVEKSNVDTTWEPVYGERNKYPEQFEQVLIKLGSGKKELPELQIEIRAYNEGVAFRYRIVSQGKVSIESELTEFALPIESEFWVSEFAQAHIEKRTFAELKRNVAYERPLLAQVNDSLFVALGEAGLVDFSRMKLVKHKLKKGVLVAELSGNVEFNEIIESPWRTIVAGNTVGELLEKNYLVLNLNKPCKIEHTDWIKPGKVIREGTLTTQGGIKCIDFAVKHNLQYIEFDAGWYGDEYDSTSDATIVNPVKRSLDLPQVVKYADSKGIGVILYVNRIALRKQLDEVLPLVSSWGVKGLKFGFVEVDSQEAMVWLHEAVRKAAEYELMVDIHDEYRPTGYSRTFPNLMTQEGVRGDEASSDNTLVLKTLFVRMLAGAADHTNCYFSTRVDETMGSHASQLAKAVCIYSPWQFLYWYDRPIGSLKVKEGAINYIFEVPELSFFDQLPVVWDDTKVIDGYPGEYAVVARKSGTTWFVGGLNGNQEREFTIPVDFLDSNTQYEATIYTDNEEVQTLTRVAIEKRTVTSIDTIESSLGKNEGMAIIIKQVL